MKVRPKRFYKSATDSMLTGVAGGIAEYFDVDPTLVRVAWVLAGLASGGLALIVYVILAIVMPRQSLDSPAVADSDTSEPGDSAGGEASRTDTIDRTRRLGMFGIVLIVIGVLLLLSNLGLMHWWRWDIFWPVLLIIGGLVILAGRLTRKQNG